MQPDKDHLISSYVAIPDNPSFSGVNAGYTLTAKVVGRLDASLVHEIDALAKVAIEPNVFRESWMLGAALEHLQTPELMLVLVRHDSNILTGLFTLSITRRFRGLPLKCLRSWHHEYSPLGSPLIAADHVGGTLAALLDWLASKRAPASILDLVSVRADGPIVAALEDALQRRKHFALHRVVRERALMNLRAPAMTGVSNKHQKEIRRKQRRLADLGKVAYRSLAPTEAVEPWVERLLAIEMRGWKGIQRTAMADAAGDRAFFLQIAEQAHRRGQLQMLELTLDDTAIAVKCNLTSGEGAFMFKIAYAEDYAKYSPGLLLELFNMDFLHSPVCSKLVWADSCDKSQHFMIDRLWLQRRQIGYYAICGRGLVARMLVRYGPRMQKVWHRVKRLARED